MTNDVGYGRPPLETRFQKGRSGNPSGRRKKRPSTFAEDVIDVLALPVTARAGDKQVRLKTLEAMFHKLCVKALNGEKRALSAAFDMIDLKAAADAEPGNRPVDMKAVTRRLGIALGLSLAELDDLDKPQPPAPPCPPPTPEELAAKQKLDEDWARWDRRHRRVRKDDRRRLFDE